MTSSLTLRSIRIAQKLLLGKTFRYLARLIGRKPLTDYNPNPHFGILNVPFGSYFLKIETTPGMLSSEMQRRTLIPTQVRELFCPMTFTSFLGVSIAYLPRREEVSDVGASLPFARAIHEEFIQCGEILKTRLEENPELLSGLQVLSRYLGKDAAESIREGLVAILEKPLQVGPVHGDFHYKNIVKVEADTAELIDADCFRPRGIQAFDAIYFALEAALVEHAKTRGWLDELLAATKGKSSVREYLFSIAPLRFEEALLLYFVDRCGQEDRYIPQLSTKGIRTLESIAKELARLHGLGDITFRSAEAAPR